MSEIRRDQVIAGIKQWRVDMGDEPSLPQIEQRRDLLDACLTLLRQPQEAWKEVGKLLNFGDMDDPWVLLGALQAHFKERQPQEPQTIWDCRVCGFGVREGAALDWIRTHGEHYNAASEWVPNKGTAYCPTCSDETLRSLIAAVSRQPQEPETSAVKQALAEQSRLKSRIAWLEGTALPHARKQEHANGFQAGWHAAIDRVREGDAPDELKALMPLSSPPSGAENKLLHALELRSGRCECIPAYGYLSRLFTHYAPQCSPLPSLMGLVTQIDNLLVGCASVTAGEASASLPSAAQESSPPSGSTSEVNR